MWNYQLKIISIKKNGFRWKRNHNIEQLFSIKKTKNDSRLRTVAAAASISVPILSLSSPCLWSASLSASSLPLLPGSGARLLQRPIRAALFLSPAGRLIFFALPLLARRREYRLPMLSLYYIYWVVVVVVVVVVVWKRRNVSEDELGSELSYKKRCWGEAETE